MWPLLLTSVISLSVVLERLFFIASMKLSRQPNRVEVLFSAVERDEMDEAIEIGKKSHDFVVRVLTYALEHRDKSYSNALLKAAGQELSRFTQRLYILDTVITLAPLLGLLATVTGMIHAFGLLGNKELSAPTVITGGIAEALIGTAFGLGIAIIALIPFNFLNSKTEEARHDIEDGSTQLELICQSVLQPR